LRKEDVSLFFFKKGVQLEKDDSALITPNEENAI
jgi:hypothetical protein